MSEVLRAACTLRGLGREPRLTLRRFYLSFSFGVESLEQSARLAGGCQFLFGCVELVAQRIDDQHRAWRLIVEAAPRSERTLDILIAFACRFQPFECDELPVIDAYELARVRQPNTNLNGRRSGRCVSGCSSACFDIGQPHLSRSFGFADLG